MPLDRVRLRGRVTLALARNHVQELRSAQLLQVAQGADKGFDIMAVDGHGPAPLFALRCCDGHAQCRADRRAGVSDSESVVFALGARRKWGEALVLLDGVEPVPPARQHLVRVSLMAYVPDKSVIGSIEHIVQGYREFYRAQARGKMTP